MSLGNNSFFFFLKRFTLSVLIISFVCSSSHAIAEREKGLPMYDADPKMDTMEVRLRRMSGRGNGTKVHFVHRLDKWTRGLLLVLVRLQHDQRCA